MENSSILSFGQFCDGAIRKNYKLILWGKKLKMNKTTGRIFPRGPLLHRGDCRGWDGNNSHLGLVWLRQTRKINGSVIFWWKIVYPFSSSLTAHWFMFSRWFDLIGLVFMFLADLDTISPEWVLTIKLMPHFEILTRGSQPNVISHVSLSVSTLS